MFRAIQQAIKLRSNPIGSWENQIWKLEKFWKRKFFQITSGFRPWSRRAPYLGFQWS